ncbi:MAG: cadherin-like domain-containing protein [Luteolibacter sp.]
MGNGAPTFGHAVQGLKNNPVAITDGSVLAGIPDTDGLALSITGTATTSVRGGTVARNGNSVTYMPASNYVGLDTFAMTLSTGLSTESSGLVTVMVTEFPVSGSITTQMSIQPGGDVSLIFFGAPESSYDIERSMDLKTWSTLQNLNSDENGLLPFTDTDPPSGSAYYRSKAK